MKRVRVAIVIWLNSENKMFLQTRNEDGPLNGYLEFPGGKIEEGETPLEAAKREFLEETPFILSTKAEFTHLKSYQYDYSDRKVEIFTYVLRDTGAEEQCLEWYPPVFSDRILEANKIIIEDLVATL